MLDRLLVATNNAGKLDEIRTLMHPLHIVSPIDLKLDLKVKETGTSFLANAYLKASAFAQASGMIALADDSGLEVDVLDGAPGVYSARYGSSTLDDAGRCQLLLDTLQEHSSPEKRTARFQCTLVVLAPDGRTCNSTGTCEGLIALNPAGTGGFGYDPIFYLPQFQQTMAQISSQEKNKLSHRNQALRRILPLMQQTFSELNT